MHLKKLAWDDWTQKVSTHQARTTDVLIVTRQY